LGFKQRALAGTTKTLPKRGRVFVDSLAKQDQAPILNIVVPQSGHLALLAGLPFFMVTLSTWVSGTSFLARHLTQ